jgi:hypothetical protein
MPASNAVLNSVAVDGSAHTGDCSSGIGLDLNILLVCFTIQRAVVFAFFRRALSVEIPVPAYICRYSFESITKATLALRFGTHADLCQIALQL